MKDKITATFSRKSYLNRPESQSPDFYIYEFINVVDSEDNKYDHKWFKETKLLKSVKFLKGEQYYIVLKDEFSIESNSLPFPIEISWDKGKVYMKNNNSIISIDEHRVEKNLSIPFNKKIGLKK